jgi:hypothetical protein
MTNQANRTTVTRAKARGREPAIQKKFPVYATEEEVLQKE